MTQIVGIYCSYCHRRYIASLFNKGPPCKHHYGRAMRDGIMGPASFFYCFAWRYKEGYQSFILQKVEYVIKENEVVEEQVRSPFKASFSNGKEIELLFLKFLKSLYSYEWVDWVEAFVSLISGGPGATMIPGWRVRQIDREFKPKEIEEIERKEESI